MGSGKYGGHRHGIPWQAKQKYMHTISVPKPIRDRAKALVFEAWAEYLRDELGIWDLENATPEQIEQIEALLRELGDSVV